jgi:hypothetical protein
MQVISKLLAALVLAHALLPSSCLQSAASDRHGQQVTGIRGTMLMGPVCPGPQKYIPDPKCADRPYHGGLAVISAASEDEVATVTPNQEGKFRIAVPPGKYLIEWIDAQPSGRKFQSSVIEVTANHMTDVHLRFDTGMR